MMFSALWQNYINKVSRDYEHIDLLSEEARGYPLVGQSVSWWLVSQKFCNKKNVGCLGGKTMSFKVENILGEV